MTSVKKPASKGIELSAFDSFDVSSLMSAGVPRAATGSNGKPLEIRLDEITEDPDQPRSESNPGFAMESLAELAESIKESGGIKTPISVQSRNAEGLYVINHGARRYRSSKLAGMSTIKAFIDDSHDDYDQAIENIQRENFTPMEIAAFIAKRESSGDNRVTIAKRLGKTKGFVTQHASLLVMSATLRAVYDEARCRDVLALYELNNLDKKFPDAVAAFVGSTPEITRSAVEKLKASTKETAIEPAVEDADRASNQEGDGSKTSGTADQKSQTPKVKIVIVMVRFGEKLFALRLDLRPSALHMAWIEDPETQSTKEVELSDLQLDSLVQS